MDNIIPVSIRSSANSGKTTYAVMDIQIALDAIKSNLKAFDRLAADGGVHGIIAILANQVYYLALVVERMHHDSL